MHVVVETTSPISEARRLLANVVVREALGALSKHIESVRLRLPIASDDSARCELEVGLTSGVALVCRGMGPSMAAAFETAAHGMRRKLFAELGLPLPARSRLDAAGPDAAAERRAT